MARLTTRSKYRASRGLTLTELLVAMALGLFLVTGIMTVFLQSKRSYQQDDELARMQESARYTLRLLTRELALAGLSGYYRFEAHTAEGTPAIASDCGTNWAVNFGQPIEFSNDVTVTPYAACIDTADIRSSTDVLAVRRTADDYTLDDGSVNPKANLDPTNAAFATRVYLQKSGLDYTFLTGGDISAADATAGSGVGLWEYYAKIFYIRPYSVAAGDNLPALCVKSLELSTMTGNCLVEGVENLQFEFGIDGNGDGVPEQFEADPTAAQLSNAVAIRVHLLMRSFNPIPGYTNDKTYTLGSTLAAAYAPNDNYFRRVYSTTVLLRNIDDV
ncbi:MAG: PilW family protein [Cellvibrionaceae bacterium]